VGQVGITTLVRDGRADELTTYLSGLPRDLPPTAAGPVVAPPSPFTGVLPPTHFARFVVVELERHTPYLFFTSAFDGDTGVYLRALAETETARQIWSHCHIEHSGDSLTAADLERYLCDEGNWRPAQYVVDALPDGVSVADVNRALSLRAQLGSLMTRAASLDPTALAHDFRQLPAIQALMARR
jgi:hypothetical protein